MTVEKAQDMINKVDRDGSGTMGFDEFVLVMTSGAIDLKTLQRKKSYSTFGAVERSEAIAFETTEALKQAKELADADDKKEMLDDIIVHDLQRAWGFDDEKHDSIWNNKSINVVSQLTYRFSSSNITPKFRIKLLLFVIVLSKSLSWPLYSGPSTISHH
jgi:hypothetical protein